MVDIEPRNRKRSRSAQSQNLKAERVAFGIGKHSRCITSRNSAVKGMANTTESTQKQKTLINADEKLKAVFNGQDQVM